MALGFKATIRNSRANVIRDAIDAGSGAGQLKIYTSPKPATDGAVGSATVLAELTFSDPCAPDASNGVLTMNAIAADTQANNPGTALWFRVTDSAGVTVMDGDCGTTGSDLNLNSTSISAGQQVSCSSFVITEGNA